MTRIGFRTSLVLGCKPPGSRRNAQSPMRFLGITETCDLGALYLRLREDGHEVKVSISEKLAEGTLRGLIERVPDWRTELDWIREAGSAGIILFEAVSEGFGKLQDSLRAAGFQVVGGSELGDRLENDRAYAQEVLEQLGLQTAATREFTSISSAQSFLEMHPGRYVLKFSGADAGRQNYVGQLQDGTDLRAVLASHQRSHGDGSATFILMDYIDGVEMGVGAYFDGQNFLQPACLDWEHKRFFAGDLGELTGEMGTVATFERTSRFFDRTLGKIAGLLRRHGHVGYVNLNTIVNDAGIWPLEFTCRFGYPGFAVLEPLQKTSWAELFGSMVGQSGVFATHPGFSVGVVLTTPPFPYSRKQVDEPVGLPIMLASTLDALDRKHIHYCEVGEHNKALVTSGLYGWTMVVTGTGSTITQAREAAYSRVRAVSVPNGRYRLDIGEKLISRDLARVESLGMFSAD